MDISKVIAISGKPGLYKIISQSKNGFIAEGLHDGKRLPVHKTHQVSGLSDVSIYTENGEEPLSKVFEAIYAVKDGQEVEAADNEQYQDFMEEVLPDYDRDRVYTSDIKKLVKWYNLLLQNDYFTAEPEEQSAEEAGKDSASAETVAEEPDNSQAGESAPEKKD